MDDVKIINDRLIASCRNASSDCGRVLHEYGINKITATFSGSGRAEDEDACNRSYEMGSWTAPWRLCKDRMADVAVSLMSLVRQRRITRAEAMRYSNDPDALERMR